MQQQHRDNNSIINHNRINGINTSKANCNITTLTAPAMTTNAAAGERQQQQHQPQQHKWHENLKANYYITTLTAAAITTIAGMIAKAASARVKTTATIGAGMASILTKLIVHYDMNNSSNYNNCTIDNKCTSKRDNNSNIDHNSINGINSGKANCYITTLTAPAMTTNAAARDNNSIINHNSINGMKT